MYNPGRRSIGLEFVRVVAREAGHLLLLREQAVSRGQGFDPGAHEAAERVFGRAGHIIGRAGHIIRAQSFEQSVLVGDRFACYFKPKNLRCARV